MKRWKKALVITLCAVLSIAAVAGVIFSRLSEAQKRGVYERIFREHYNARVAQFEEENKAYEKGEVQVAFIGDSLTEGYDVASHYPQYTVVNRGIGGDTTFGLEQRLEQSVYEIEPQVVVMLIGANNMETMMLNYGRIVRKLQRNLPNTEIVLVSLTAMGRDWGRKNDLAQKNNEKIRAIAERRGVTFVDLFTPLLNPETGEIYEEYTTDGGHQTALGYEVFTATITPAIEELLS